MTHLDQFDDIWDRAPEGVELRVVQRCKIVPMTMPAVAMLVITKAEDGAPEVVKTQVVMTPDYARAMGEALIRAANISDPPNN